MSSSDLEVRAAWLGRHVLPLEAELRGWLRNRKTRGLEIDDIIQETYSRLLTIESVEHIRNVRAYTFQIAGSVLIDYLRRLKVVSITPVADIERLQLASEIASPETQVIDRDELARLTHAIVALPVRVREVFVLRRIYGVPQQQVARKLDIAESTVEKHMGRAYLLLMKAFGYGGRPPPDSSIGLSNQDGVSDRNAKKDR
jgi:RNA polymerase sigma-70 factor (ECF subfamily)